jgi:alkylation response protein AidB-like acyl-CoA dehydrogenase
MVRAILNARRRGDQPGDVAPGEGQLRGLLSAGELELPLPCGGRTAERWLGLAGWGRRDLGSARLVEGHTDAVAILAEASRHARPEALYGVWASRSGGTGARLVPSGDGLGLHGTVRFCSGAHTIDRALVVADAPEPADGHVLVEIAVDQSGLVPDPDTWATAAMAAADTVDVRFDGVRVSHDALVGPAGQYTTRVATGSRGRTARSR